MNCSMELHLAPSCVLGFARGFARRPSASAPEHSPVKDRRLIRLALIGYYLEPRPQRSGVVGGMMGTSDMQGLAEAKL